VALTISLTTTEGSSSETLSSEPRPKPLSSDQLHLRLLATSDLHVHILPFDYYSGSSTDRLGLARTASLIAQARAEVENCLLFDNGDFLQGSPLGDYIAQKRGQKPGDPHPMLTAMNHLRYDAGTLGNHEFNYGLDFLEAAVADADFPIVSANVHRIGGPQNDPPLVRPYVILKRDLVDIRGKRWPIRIGVIGFTPPQILTWDRRHLAGKLTTCDIVEAARIHVPRMRQEGADLIIALSHSGIGPPDAIPGMENASTALAQIDGIDAVIAGHSHLVFPSADFAPNNAVDPTNGTLCGKPAVMPGFYGSHLGVIDLALTREAGKVSVLHHRAEARPIWHRGGSGVASPPAATDEALARLISPVHLETLDWTGRSVGHTDIALHSFFALITEAPALDLVATAQRLDVERALAQTDFTGLDVLASVAPFKAGGRGGPENYTDIPAGNVMLRHAADLYIHPNTSAALRLSGAEIADWLEYAAGIFNQIPAGSRDAPLINPDFPSFNFDVIYGVQFQIDLARPPRFDLRGRLINPQSRRISGLTYQGRPLDEDRVFAIATNSYRASIDADYLPAAASRMIYNSRQTNLDLVLHYFATPRAKLSSPPPPSRRFLRQKGSTVTFDSAPAALGHLSDLRHLQIEEIGLTPAGFLRFRLHL
jgi:2',3'-cyclic-nucleotide 2'-phosphodiesterase / 3'-nucleotidase